MLKKNAKIALAVFLVFSFKDFLSGEEIKWVNSLVFAVIVFTIYLFLDWTNEPYDWSKHKR
ncbi:hypothetical protein KQ939_16240 [Planococcus sp. CP5-4]|uniref:hypothetical protein n=1 Tax=unclassified Planococcus (in: firmicutes) TaxID=2662419 RepID=UPI001C22E764|nr:MULTISPECIES: hypothetical protein [unclassified Planococcus (in: firmicutes)]MBU9673873.1 hypothetical protein [Planococcus sp. CP5-4_YE]MBV0909743.1 hypothetical protein [Planococcus sp. CP5-4_UN]MBW6065227.1 hypothetical protein [Planococcus sp. CP5-4]